MISFRHEHDLDARTDLCLTCGKTVEEIRRGPRWKRPLRQWAAELDAIDPNVLINAHLLSTRIW